MNFSINRSNKLSTIWCMKTSLLSQPQCQEKIKQELETYFVCKMNSVSNNVLHWKRVRNEKYNIILDQIRKLEKTNKSSPNDADTTCLRTLREEFCLFWSPHQNDKVTWYTSGNRPDVLQARQIKCKAIASKIPYMQTAQGCRASDPGDIANCFRDFYTSLYNLKTSTDTTNPETSFISQLHPINEQILTPHSLCQKS